MKPNKCPTCRRSGPWFDAPYGPFCSKRCRLLDLGKWLGEENRISEPLKAEHLEPYAELPPGLALDQPESDATEKGTAAPRRRDPSSNDQ